ncbi:hypothetical protein AB0O07_18280 [Streptomyces sp. NPDC093085]|uniref:hypothetical protein n=1 Tax=Streptomyces sp. NPDC093085 TaxID=3155068 RepID=UPI00342BC756
MSDTSTLLDQILPAAEAAAIAYGASVLTRTQDQAADATVGLGQRLLRKFLNRETGTAPGSASAQTAPVQTSPVYTAVVHLAEAGADPGMLTRRRGELREALGTALRDTPRLADELASLFQAPQTSPNVHAEGDRSVAVGGNNNGSITTGDGTRDTPRW